MENKDFYKILQVDVLAESEVITAAYRRLALKYHPDTNSDIGALQRMQEINTAYEVLGDPSKRAEYDLLRGTTASPTLKNESKSDKGTLIHESDFSIPSTIWTEHDEANKRIFMKDGYFHMAMQSNNSENEDNYTMAHLLPFELTNFRLYFEAQVSDASDPECEYGLYFHRRTVNNSLYSYIFGVNVDEVVDINIPTYMLYLIKANSGFPLVEFCETRIINSRKVDLDIVAKKLKVERRNGWAAANRFLIDITDHKITLGANGKILKKVNDNTLQSGFIGLSLRSMKNSYTEVRFRNFRLYSK